MERRQTKNSEDYDVPIEKPFDELPAWFVNRLNSRLVTRRFPKDRNSNNMQSERVQRPGIGGTVR